MEIKEEDLRNRYADMKTNELKILLKNAGLSEIAYSCIIDELKNRNVWEQVSSEIEEKRKEKVNSTKLYILSSLTKFLKTMLWVSLGIAILTIITDVMQMNLISERTFSRSAAKANDTRQLITGLLNISAFIITGIAFLIWIYRANSNCHKFGAKGMNFTPGWSIGYYFIPILNLYKPYQAMKEIWKVSTNPMNWQNEVGSPLLAWWWALWLFTAVLGQASFRMLIQADTISALQEATIGFILTGIISVPLYIVSITLITTIFTKQENFIKRGKVFYENELEEKSKHSQYIDAKPSNQESQKTTRRNKIGSSFSIILGIFFIFAGLFPTIVRFLSVEMLSLPDLLVGFFFLIIGSMFFGKGIKLWDKWRVPASITLIVHALIAGVNAYNSWQHTSTMSDREAVAYQNAAYSATVFAILLFASGLVLIVTHVQTNKDHSYLLR